MEAQCDDSKIFSQFLPTLLHLATVKVGFLLMKNFDFATMISAYNSIQEGTLINSHKIYKDPKFFKNQVTLLECQLEQLKCEIELFKCERTSEQLKRKLELQKSALEERRSSLERIAIEYFKTDPLIKQYRAQEILNLIPPCLRLRVMEAVQEMEFCGRRWKSYHSPILESEEGECILYWKSDGTINRTKTAQQLTLNEKIDIRKRYRLACTYCFKEIIHALWVEMNDSDRMYIETINNCMVRFWVKRMLWASLFHWKHDFRNYLHHYLPQIATHFISVFPLFQPQTRKEFLPRLKNARLDVFRLCFHAMTKEEEWILRSYPRKVLLSYLQWPLRSMFLETLEKVWEYIDRFDFLFVLEHLFFIKKYEYFDISDLFEVLWEKSPSRWRKFAKKYPCFGKKIKSWLKEIRKKRKAHLDELRRFTKEFDETQTGR